MATLQEKVREAARVAEEMCVDGNFNAMSWLDLALEDTPESFDCFFDTPWEKLSETEREERTGAIRRVL